MLVEPVQILKAAIEISAEPSGKIPLVSRIFTRESAEDHLRTAANSAAML
jgi:hypothetical protein